MTHQRHSSQCLFAIHVDMHLPLRLLLLLLLQAGPSLAPMLRPVVGPQVPSKTLKQVQLVGSCGLA